MMMTTECKREAKEKLRIKICIASFIISQVPDRLDTQITPLCKGSASLESGGGTVDLNFALQGLNCFPFAPVVSLEVACAHKLHMHSWEHLLSSRESRDRRSGTGLHRIWITAGLAIP